nr:hypothetical protein [Tanacetum cinerariifolium]
AVLHVLVAAAVVGAGGGVDELDLVRGLAVFRVFGSECQHHAGQLADRIIVDRVADVIDLAAGLAILVGDDLHQRRDAVVDVGEGALLLAAVDQLDGFAAH